jgi:hypothetical protein
VEQFHAVMETARKLTPDSPAPSYVVHRGILKMDQGNPSAMEYFTLADPFYEEKLLTSLKEQISTAELRMAGVSLGMVDFPEGGGKKGIFVAVPSGRISEQGPIEKISFFMIDPIKAFPGIGKLSLTDESAFLFFKTGKVLAHSLPAFVGTDLMRIPDLKDPLTHLFVGAQTGFVQKYSPIDGTRQRLAVVRAGVLPFAVGVERKAPSPFLSMDWFAEQWESGAARKNLGGVFVLISCSLFLFAVLSSWASRRLRREIEDAKKGRLNPETESAFTRPGALSEDLLQAAERAAEQFALSRAEMEAAQRSAHSSARSLAQESAQVDEVIARIEKAYAVESVERELVGTSAELIQGHAIYFRYQARIQNLAAVSVSQDIPADPMLKAQIYVRKDIEQQVEQFSASGKAASLTHYAPLKKVIQSHFEGAAYEAWAVTAAAEVTGKASMVGVLILLHSGEVNPSVRPLLARLIRESGNHLLVLGNKISPKGRRSGVDVTSGFSAGANLT